MVWMRPGGGAACVNAIVNLPPGYLDGTTGEPYFQLSIHDSVPANLTDGDRVPNS